MYKRDLIAILRYPTTIASLRYDKYVKRDQYICEKDIYNRDLIAFLRCPATISSLRYMRESVSHAHLIIGLFSYL